MYGKAFGQTSRYPQAVNVQCDSDTPATELIYMYKISMDVTCFSEMCPTSKGSRLGYKRTRVDLHIPSEEALSRTLNII